MERLTTKKREKMLRGRRLFSSSVDSVVGDVTRIVNLRYPVSRRDIPKLARHSQPSVSRYSSFVVHTVPVLADSYAFVIIDSRTKQAALVDPAEPDLVMSVVER